MIPLDSLVRQPLLPLDGSTSVGRDPVQFSEGAIEPFTAEAWLPPGLAITEDHQTALPRIAKDKQIIAAIEQRLPQIPTRHHLFRADARSLDFIPSETVHLILTSPPYWTLKQYRDHPSQLGAIGPYETFLSELRKVWAACYRVLVPGGRMVCVVGDVCLSRRKNRGEHTVVPLHAAIQEQCRVVGFSNLAPIVWNKIANAKYEATGNGGGFLGKPFEPNAVVKNDIEFILMERKSGGYRSPSVATRVLSVIPADRHKVWFQQVWTGLTGATTRNHPAPFPLELAERLVRMFSFVGDIVLDPFAGTGTTNAAAGLWGRNSIGIEIDPDYFAMAVQRVTSVVQRFGSARIMAHLTTPKEDQCLTSTEGLPTQSPTSGTFAKASRRGREGRQGRRTRAAEQR